MRFRVVKRKLILFLCTSDTYRDPTRKSKSFSPQKTWGRLYFDEFRQDPTVLDRFRRVPKDRFRQIPTVLDRFRQVPIDGFRQIPNIFDIFRQFWTDSDGFRQTDSDRFRRFSTDPTISLSPTDGTSIDTSVWDIFKGQTQPGTIFYRF